MKFLWILLTSLLLINIGCAQPGVKRVAKISFDFKMGNKMDDAEFWKIIDHSFVSTSGDRKAQEQAIVKKIICVST